MAALLAQSSAPPKNARDAFEAGVKAAEGKRFADSQRYFKRAVALDPKYAAAWQALGKLLVEQNDLPAARKAYEGAIRAEPARADFYLELAALEQNAQNWTALADVSGLLLKVNASDYPEAYLLNATGYYQMGDLATAEERARAGEKLDARQQYPKINELLGWILAQKGNSAAEPEKLRWFEAAAEEFRRYLKAAPATKHTEEVRATLEQLESLLPEAPSAREPLNTAIAAKPPAPPPGIVLRSMVTFVQVDVIAQDEKGRPVADLKNEDFTVFDNGKPQKATSFVVETSVQKAAARRPARAPNTFSNRITGTESSRAGYAVILVDWFNSRIGVTQRARPQVMRILRQMGPSDKVALYSLDLAGLRVVNELGSDPSEILKSLSTLNGKQSPCRAKALDDADPHADTLCDDPLMPINMIASYLDRRFRDTLQAFRTIADHLAGVQGRKSLIWISSGIPDLVKSKPEAPPEITNAVAPVRTYGEELNLAVRKLNNAGVSLYPVDPRGLTTISPASIDNGDIQLTTPLMDSLASRTGGVAFHGRNDLDAGIQAALDDSRVTYLLGYYVPQDASQTGFHRLSVKVNRPGVRVRYREGYTIEEPGAVVPEDQKTQLAQASLNLMGATTIPFDVTALRKQNALTLRITVNPANLGLALNGDRWQGKIDVATRFATDKAEDTSTLWFEPIDIDLSRQNYEERSRDGLVFPKTLDIPAGAKKVIVLVRSGALGTVGSLSIPLSDIRQN
jgi:VWFA-related protein